MVTFIESMNHVDLVSTSDLHTKAWHNFIPNLWLVCIELRWVTSKVSQVWNAASLYNIAENPLHVAIYSRTQGLNEGHEVYVMLQDFIQYCSRWSGRKFILEDFFCYPTQGGWDLVRAHIYIGKKPTQVEREPVVYPGFEPGIARWELSLLTTRVRCRSHLESYLLVIQVRGKEQYSELKSCQQSYHPIHLHMWLDFWPTRWCWCMENFENVDPWTGLDM